VSKQYQRSAGDEVDTVTLAHSRSGESIVRLDHLTIKSFCIITVTNKIKKQAGKYK
jgi:hypothetical protein